MISYLNLLPKKVRDQVRLEKIYGLLKKEVVLLLFVLVFFNSGIFYIKFNLERNLRGIETALAQSKEQNKSLILKVQGINQEIESYKIMQTGFSLKSILFLELAALVPEGVYLESLSLDAQNYLVLQGYYRYRDDLLKFKSNLAAGFISEIDFPIANLLQQSNGDFIIKGRISPVE